MIFCLSIVNAVNWYQFSNSGLNLAGNTGWTGYATNYPNNIDFNYTTCNTNGATTNAIAYDVDNNGFEDIVFVGLGF